MAGKKKTTRKKSAGKKKKASGEVTMTKVKAVVTAAIKPIKKDLDGLKTVNDTLGHAAGDLLIQEAAKALLAGVRTEDIVARIGGDEFAIILPGVDSAAAAEVVIRIQECVTAQNDHSSPFNLCISLGVVTVESGGSLEEAMSLADKRMYEEKFAKKQR